jgi:hypothetical protein
MMGTEMILKILVSFDHLTWLMAQEDFTKWYYCYKKVNKLFIVHQHNCY